jgi:hypothetical protein
MTKTHNGIVIRNVLFAAAVFATACVGNKNKYAGEPYSDSEYTTLNPLL